MLGLVDEFDVPIFEKSIMENSIEETAILKPNLVFINNKENI